MSEVSPLDLEHLREHVSRGETDRKVSGVLAIDRLPPKEVVILGAGLAGLSAGYILSKAGWKLILLEGDSRVGGLAKTVNLDGFLFDLGGHRFFTTNRKIEQLVKEILKGDFLEVKRKSKIFLFKRYFDYPLRPANAIFGLGPSTTCQILWDYGKEKLRQIMKPPRIVSLEDWVVSQFGRKMFDLYFRQYSEKVWGRGSGEISEEWVAQRIKGLSLWTAIKNAFMNSNGKEIATLSDRFIYPRMGIGQISDEMRNTIEAENPVLTGTRVVQINHEDYRIKNVIARANGRTYEVAGAEFVSTIPLTNLLKMLRPLPPGDILEAASRLKYRDMVIVTVMLRRERVTDSTWIYLPEKGIPFGRLHEPPNWSPHTAPKGKTHLVSEYFCSKGDKIWHLSDEELSSLTVQQLEELGFVQKNQVIGTCVVRAANAYPILEVGYEPHYNKILQYLEKFRNLQVGGRTGMFRYHNMDHAMESGIRAAENILKRQLPDAVNIYA